MLYPVELRDHSLTFSKSKDVRPVRSLASSKSKNDRQIEYMKKMILIVILVFVIPAAALMVITKRWQDLGRQESDLQSLIWTTGQLNLVVERTFSFASMTYLMGDQEARAEALGLLDKSAARIKTLSEVHTEYVRDVSLGLTWLRALLTEVSGERNPVFRLKAYREVVVENQKKLGDYNEKMSNLLSNVRAEKGELQTVSMFIVLLSLFAQMLILLSIRIRFKSSLQNSQKTPDVLAA